MDEKYMMLRQQLNELGYSQCFLPECLPLVENLVADLLHTTRSLQHYMGLSKEALQQRDALRATVEPLKCDNAKLIQENNSLHLTLIQLKEDSDRNGKNAKIKIRKRENELALLEHKYLRVKALCRECQLKNICADTVSSRNRAVTKPDTSQKQTSNCTETYTYENGDAVLEEQLKETIQELNREREEHVTFSEDIAFLRRQLDLRDKEINRLGKLLQGGRPIAALNKDCGCTDFEGRLLDLSSELQQSEDKNQLLDSQLKEALFKQREAMSRAVQLADKNLLLEKELRSVDQMALKLESECNNQIKEKQHFISNLKNESDFTQSKIRALEAELARVIGSHQKFDANLESNSNEICALKLALDASNHIKDNLVRENKELLEANRQLEIMASKKYENFDRDSQSEKNIRRSSNRHREEQDKETSRTSPQNDRGRMSKFNREEQDRDSLRFSSKNHAASMSRDELLLLLEKERHYNENKIKEIQMQINDKETLDQTAAFNKLKLERDHYYNEYESLKKNLCSSQPNYTESTSQLRNKITELEQQVQLIKMQNEHLIKAASFTEQLDLSRFQQQRYSYRSKAEPDNYVHSMVNRLEEDLKKAHVEIQNLERERDSLRNKLAMASESNQNSQQFESLIRETRENYNVQTLNCMSQFDSLRRECEAANEKLKLSETEQLHTKSLLGQLKNLQVENDKNISDSRSQIFESKKEIHKLEEIINSLEKSKMQLEHENQLLRSDKNSLKENLSRVDHERDQLMMGIDDKTEKVFSLQHQLRAKDTNIEMLQNRATELDRKIELLKSENASMEHKVRDAQISNEALSAELDSVTKQRDCASIENRRLHSDLTTVSNDLSSVNREYELSRKEVEEMKQQLQHYVDEVRRIEDILSRKEAERTEMLDHFASLSHEATVLETNNHSLESEAASKGAQLQLMVGKIDEIERKLQTRESVVEKQEEKMASLMFKISKLENDLEQQTDIHKVTVKNLEYARETCITLENQKKNIMAGYNETDLVKNKLNFDLKTMTEEKNRLEDEKARLKVTVESLEGLLNNSRREAIEVKLLLQDAIEETKQWKLKVENLQKRLNITAGEGNSSRQKAEDAAKQLQELQWQMTDERFQRVRLAQNEEKSKFHFSGTL